MSHASGERTAGDRAGSRRASGSKGSFHRNLRHIGPSLLNIKKESPKRRGSVRGRNLHWSRAGADGFTAKS
jgi:hypothetical protein